jgi:tetratricopeptide (TPR) repeat protein
VGTEEQHFKIGVSFTGAHRETVRQVVTELLDETIGRDDVFFDEWHQEAINGPNADLELKSIYSKRCDCVVVFLSKDYDDKPWTGGIEWDAIRRIMNAKEKKLCFLNVDNVDIDTISGLDSTTSIARKIDGLSARDIAEFIRNRYRQIIGESKGVKAGTSEVITNLTAGNQFFSGRDSLFEVVHEAFNGETPVGQFAVYGKSGVGKTAFARAYALKYQEEYKDAIWWIDAEDINSGCSDFLSRAGVEDVTADPEKIREAFLSWCQRHNSWLFIFDNALDYDAFLGYTLGLSRGHILITTTDPFEFFESFQQRWLDVWQEDEVSTYVKRKFAGRSGFSFESEAASIAAVSSRLGFLPLAVAQAVSYIYENNLSFQTYDDYLTSFPEDMFDENEPRDHISIYKTVRLAYDRLEDEEQRQLLQLCSYLAPSGISKWMFVEGKRNLPIPIRERCDSQRLLDAPFRYLNRLSLLEAMGIETFAMHRLTQEIVRGLQNDDQTCLIADFNVLTTVIEKNQIRGDGYRKFGVLALHAKYVYRYVSDFFSKNPGTLEFVAIFGRLRDAYSQLAHGYRKTAAYADSLAMNSEQVRVDSLIARDGGIDQAVSQLERARILREAGMNGDALESVHRAISFLNKIKSAADSDFDLEALLADEEKALAFVSDSIDSWSLGSDIVERTLGSAYNEEALILTAMNEMAPAMRAAQKSEELLGEVLDPMRRELSRAAVFTNRGLGLRSAGQNSEALEQYEKSLSIYDQLGLLDKNVDRVAMLYNNMAAAHEQTGGSSLQSAIDYSEMALNILEVIYPDGAHVDIGISCSIRGRALMQLGRFEEAMQWLQRDVDICEESLEGNHPYLLTAYMNMVELYNSMSVHGFDLAHNCPNLAQNCSRALRVFSNAWVIDAEASGSPDTYVGAVFEALADVYLSVEDRRSAMQCYRNAFKVSRDAGDQDLEAVLFREDCERLWNELGYDRAAFEEWMASGDRRGEGGEE